MNINNSLRLDRLLLKNFRCFADCTIDLHPELTVLVADNGQGKTAILDGIGIALGLFINTIMGTSQLHRFDRTDVRLVRQDGSIMQPQLPAYFRAEGYINGKFIHWHRRLNGYGKRARTSTKDAEILIQEAQRLRESVEKYSINDMGAPLLPIIAFYGTGRLWSEHRLTEEKKTYRTISNDRMSGYIDCLSPSSSFKGFVIWYETMWNAVRDPKSSILPPESRPQTLLAAIQAATKIVLEPTKWNELDWDFENRILRVMHPDHGVLPISALSDGIRTMIALVADIAYRCVSLNPHLSDKAAQLTPGIVLIDEIDMHLHPKWQQKVVDLLRTAFPSIQLIVSTHSPHVLSTVDRESIRIIRVFDGEAIIDTPTYQTRGVESADVLARIMDVDSVPQVEEAQQLSEYRALIQQHLLDTPKAQKLREQLEKHFGSTHPVIEECERLIRFEQLKQNLSSSSKLQKD